MSVSFIAKIIAGGAVGIEALSFIVNRGDSLIRPPGAKAESDFSARCIRCGKCIEACPYESIHAYRDLSNVAGGTPYLDVRAKACRMCEDFPCVKVCPTNALRDVETRYDVHMGTAVINQDTCIALQGMRCEVCYRACPLIDEAITIDYRKREGDNIHSVFAPIINENICTGCGWCVERCVTDEPAITIVRNVNA